MSASSLTVRNALVADASAIVNILEATIADYERLWYPDGTYDSLKRAKLVKTMASNARDAKKLRKAGLNVMLMKVAVEHDGPHERVVGFSQAFAHTEGKAQGEWLSDLKHAKKTDNTDQRAVAIDLIQSQRKVIRSSPHVALVGPLALDDANGEICSALLANCETWSNKQSLPICTTADTNAKSTMYSNHHFTTKDERVVQLSDNVVVTLCTMTCA